jgi:3-oxoadipate enol-lactonase
MGAVPYLKTAGCRFYYELMGPEGAPRLVLIRGFARSGRYWGPLLPHLERGLSLLVLDNRGVGRSDSSRPPYSTGMLADDVAAAMDHAGWERAHVFGMSLGGMIAQQFALRHAARVDRLVLGCTTPGGRHAVRYPLRSVFTLLRAALVGGGRGVDLILPLLVSDASLAARPEIRELWQRLAVEEPRSAPGLIGQLIAARRHDVYAELSSITASTLVLTGDADQLIVPENSRRLAARIPDAALEMLPGARHDFTPDQPAAAAEALLRFLLGASRA